MFSDWTDVIFYCILQEAYRMLGKTQTAMDQLLMHIASAIHTKSWNLVHVHAAMAASCNPEDLSKRPYPELCQTVTVDLFLPCLVDLTKVKIRAFYYLCNISLCQLKSYAWKKPCKDLSHCINTPSFDSIFYQCKRFYFFFLLLVSWEWTFVSIC